MGKKFYPLADRVPLEDRRRLDLPLYDAIECGVISGDYDPQTGRVYLACAYSDGDSPIVHVLEVQ